MSVSTFHNIRSSYQDASLGFHTLGEIPTCGDSNRTFSACLLSCLDCPPSSSVQAVGLDLPWISCISYGIISQSGGLFIYLVSYLLINFAKRPGSLTEQAPQSKLLSACECVKFLYYPLLDLIEWEGCSKSIWH